MSASCDGKIRAARSQMRRSERQGFECAEPVERSGREQTQLEQRAAERMKPKVASCLRRRAIWTKCGGSVDETGIVAVERCVMRELRTKHHARARAPMRKHTGLGLAHCERNGQTE